MIFEWIFEQFWLHFGSPRRPQDRRIEGQKRHKKGDPLQDRFFDEFGTILGRFGIDFGTIFDCFLDRFWNELCITNASGPCLKNIQKQQADTKKNIKWYGEPFVGLQTIGGLTVLLLRG